MRDKTINVADNVLTNVRNNLRTNVRNSLTVIVVKTVSINSNDRKVRYKKECYMLDTVTDMGMVTIFCYHCAKHRPKRKSIDTLTVYEMKEKE